MATPRKPHPGKKPPRPPGEPSANGHEERPAVLVTLEESEVHALAVKALTGNPHVYQTGGFLVTVAQSDNRVSGEPPSLRILPLTEALVRLELTNSALFMASRETEEGEQLRRVRPPWWACRTVHQAGRWEGIRHLEGLCGYPVLGLDGKIRTRAGYDPDTRLYLTNDYTGLKIPPSPSQRDAVKAVCTLKSLVEEFPFKSDCHFAAWVAALLTPIAQPGYHGRSPLFLADANRPGCGKSLLVNAVGIILSGRPLAAVSYTNTEDDLRKLITGIVMSGTPIINFDDVKGKFGNPTLHRAVTLPVWQDRWLGGNRNVQHPMSTIFFASGNNVQVSADMVRRCCHIRLHSVHEHPEERTDISRPDLPTWLLGNRLPYLKAAATILQAYCAAGKPPQPLTPWGGFEAWSGLVRSAVVWSGLDDPGETRQLLREQAAKDDSMLAVALECLHELYPNETPFLTGDICDRLWERTASPATETERELRDALADLVPRKTAHALGTLFRDAAGANYGGRCIVQGGTFRRAIRWKIVTA